MTNSRTELLNILNELDYQDNLPYLHWIEDYWRERGLPLNFEEHKYQRDWYETQAETMAWMKAGQTGGTTRVLSEALYVPDIYYENTMYFMPSSSQMGDFVQGRVDPVLGESEYFLPLVSDRSGKNPQKVGLKRMHKGLVYFRGAQNPRQAITVDADVVVMDEFDRFSPEMTPYFDKRLAHSNRKWKRYVSTPTIPNYGIHKVYLEGTQRVWEVICNHCGQQQEMNYQDNVDEENQRLICMHCKEEIIAWQLDGVYVEQNPGGKFPSWQTSGLYTKTLDLPLLIEDMNSNNEARITQAYNQTLGLPYEPKGATITAELLDACKRDYQMTLDGLSGVYIGVDVGKLLHTWVRNAEGKTLWVGTFKDFTGETDSLEWLIKHTNARCLVIDALPETREAAKLESLFPGRVFLCYYNLELAPKAEWWKFEKGQVRVNRTASLDDTFSQIKSQKTELPVDVGNVKDLYSHLKALTRIFRENRSGEMIAEYVHTAPDHYAHADNYANIAAIQSKFEFHIS